MSLEKRWNVRRVDLSDVLSSIDPVTGNSKQFNTVAHDLYDTPLEMNRPRVDAVSEWHDVLREYMRTPFLFCLELTQSELDDVVTPAARFYRCSPSSAVGGAKWPGHLREELDELSERVQHFLDERNPFNNGSLPGYNTTSGWFIRMDCASPKDALSGTKTCVTGKEVVSALVRSRRVHDMCVGEHLGAARNHRIYFSRFDPKWDVRAEWRVFVFEGAVRAISQYAWFSECHSSLACMDNEQLIATIAKPIEKFVMKSVLSSIAASSTVLRHTCVVDVYHEPWNFISGPDGPWLVEMNAYDTAGACLFDWRSDHDVLPLMHPSSFFTLNTSSSSTTNDNWPELRIAVTANN
jgi:hypothetical protein